jgi:hypothetical protein
MFKYAVPTLVAALALPALAMGQSASDLDVNGDAVLTLDEVQASFPEIDTDSFTVIYLNADGVLDAGEVSAAQVAGLMPPTDG